MTTLNPIPPPSFFPTRHFSDFKFQIISNFSSEPFPSEGFHHYRYCSFFEEGGGGEGIGRIV
jgi:hypothetical protein